MVSKFKTKEKGAYAPSNSPAKIHIKRLHATFYLIMDSKGALKGLKSALKQKPPPCGGGFEEYLF